MKNLILLLALATGFTLHAQSEFDGKPNNYHSRLVSTVNAQSENIREAGIRSYSEFRDDFGTNGELKKRVLIQTREFNEQGQLLHQTSFNKKGKKERECTYTYDDKQRLISASVSRYNLFGSRQYNHYFAYHNDSLVAVMWGTKTDPNGEKEWMYRFVYDNQNRVIEEKSYRKGKLYGRITFTYYEDGSKKEVNYYRDSLKLQKTFRYDCGIEESLLSKKQKDTLTFCSRAEELPDGSTRTIMETRDEKGRIIRIVYTSSKDGRGHIMEKYNAKNHLIYRFETNLDDDGVRTLIYTRYSQRGKLRRKVAGRSRKDAMGLTLTENLEKDKVVSSYFKVYTLYK